MDTLTEQSGQVARISGIADESFKKTKEETDAIKIVSQGELNAIRTSLLKVEEEVSDMKENFQEDIVEDMICLWCDGA